MQEVRRSRVLLLSQLLVGAWGGVLVETVATEK
jgi:hypothetical protein